MLRLPRHVWQMATKATDGRSLHRKPARRVLAGEALRADDRSHDALRGGGARVRRRGLHEQNRLHHHRSCRFDSGVPGRYVLLRLVLRLALVLNWDRCGASGDGCDLVLREGGRRAGAREGACCACVKGKAFISLTGLSGAGMILNLGIATTALCERSSRPASVAGRFGSNNGRSRPRQRGIAGEIRGQ